MVEVTTLSDWKVQMSLVPILFCWETHVSQFIPGICNNRHPRWHVRQGDPNMSCLPVSLFLKHIVDRKRDGKPFPLWTIFLIKFLPCPAQYLSDMREHPFAHTYQTLFDASGARGLDTPSKDVLQVSLWWLWWAWAWWCTIFLPARLCELLQSACIQSPSPISTVCNIYLPPAVPVSLAELTILISQLPPQFFWQFQRPQYPVGSAITDNRGRTVSNVCARFDIIFLNTGAATFLCLRSGSSSALDLAFYSPRIAVHLELSILEVPTTP
jgi:hypothetical protein